MFRSCFAMVSSPSLCSAAFGASGSAWFASHHVTVPGDCHGGFQIDLPFQVVMQTRCKLHGKMATRFGVRDLIAHAKLSKVKRPSW